MKTLTKYLIGGGAAVLGFLLFAKKGGAAPSGGMASAIVNSGTGIHLRAQTYYGGRLNMGPGLPPFSLDADAETIAKGLSALGFQNVEVFMDQASSPFKTGDLAGPATDHTRWFRAKWGDLTATVPKPLPVEALYIVRAPGA